MEKNFLGAVGGFFKRTDYIFWILTIAASVYGFALINSVSRSADSEKGFLATQILAVVPGLYLRRCDFPDGLQCGV